MKTLLTFILSFVAFSLQAQIQLSAPGVKWDESYTFDCCNLFKIDFYARQNELMRSVD